MVGISGKNADRRETVRAIGRSRWPWICDAEVPMPSNIIGHTPASRSFMAGAVPR
jgi:hypothetical protein